MIKKTISLRKNRQKNRIKTEFLRKLNGLTLGMRNNVRKNNNY